MFEEVKYDPLLGDLVWCKPGKKRILGSRAGCLFRNGYIRTKLNGKSFSNHSVIWYLHTNHLPKYPLEEVDHIDGNRKNNFFSNLRLVSKRENCNNFKIHRQGKLVGGSFHKASGLWHARIFREGKSISLGYFKTEIEANERYLEVKND